jgi:aerobic-type carbon monoxide dehydrogenase small subunit (CoxS/CutS family)
MPLYRLTVNRRTHDLEASPDTPLLWILRDRLGLTGTKYGCGDGDCGACTVHLGGEAAQACQVPVSEAAGTPITTIEGLSEDASHPVQRAWLEEDVAQCGYCQAGMIMAAAALLRQKPNPSDSDIDKALWNLCRCGTYQRVRRAVHRASDAPAGRR